MKINIFFLCIPLLASFSLFGQPTYTMADTVLAKRYLEEAKVLMDSGKYDAALGKLDTAGVILEGTVGEEHLLFANVMHSKSRCFFFKGKYEKAGECGQKALEIRLKKLGSEHIDVAASFNNLGIVYYEKSDYDQAVQCHQRALYIYLKNIGIEHPFVAGSYTNLGNTYRRKGDYLQAGEHHQKALEIRLKALGLQHLDVAASYNNLGNVFFDKGDYDRACDFYQKALEIKLNKLGTEHPSVASSFNNLGLIYRQKGDYSRAVAYHQKALSIRIKIFGSEHHAVAESFDNLGIVFYEKGDYDRAVEYHHKALDILLKTLGNKHPDMARAFDNLGIVYYQKGDYDRAVECHQKALDILLKTLGNEHPDMASPFYNLGIVYNKIGANDLAIKYHQKALDILLKTFGPEHSFVAASLYNLAGISRDNGDMEQASKFLQKALDIQLKTLGPKHPYVAMSFNSFGELYKYLGNLGKAEPYLLKALQSLRYASLDSFQKVNSVPVLLETFTAKGHFYEYFYSTSRRREHLYTARQSFSEALAAIAYQRKTLEDPSSKSTLAKQSSGVYEGGIAVNHLLYQQTDSLHYLHEAFHYAEQSKALTLYESMNDAEALHIAGIPDSLLQKEYDLRVDIAYYEKQRQYLYSEGKEETDSTVLKISGKIFDLRRTYEQLIDTFEIKYPDYYRLRYDLHTEDVTSIQRDLLQPDQAMLEYYVGDSSVFIFLLKNDDYRLFEVKKDFPLEDWVRQLRHGIYGYRTEPPTDTRDAVAANEYAEAAWQLYQKLLAPVDSLLPRRVVIIPDGILGYVPFEALLSEKPAQSHRFQSHSYFCLKHDVSYCYSATLLREMTQKRHKKEPKESFLAFAPFYTSSYQHLEDLIGNVIMNASAFDSSMISRTSFRDFKPLPKSGEEVAAINKIWDGRYLINADATEQKFNQIAGDYRILHLATHGRADNRVGDYSYLAFAQIPDSIENELLYVREIYNLSLNADLVTLSACETGIGELQRGEGIISLARAFSYAGAKSIVTTLWPVDDARTKDLMVAFYQNLKTGMTKDAALSQAKRDFLKTSHAHPYFWAGFAAIGDMGAIR